jgi:superoxide dismutase, Fe-Mn family
MIHQLEPLPYAYDALEPYFDALTMQIHHTKHHQAYIDKLNAALQDQPKFQGFDAATLLTHLPEVPEQIRTAVRNHGGGHANHSFFWPILKKEAPFSGEISKAITATFGSYKNFKKDFKTAGTTLFGSGWAWLVINDGKLEIMTTANQDNPVSQRMTPILGIDVWEHAYYLKYQNRRPDYIDAFFNVINWEKVDELYQSAR